jgi:hypothetical protein
MFFKNWSADTKAIVGTLLLTAALITLGIFSFRKVWPSNSSGWLIWLGLAAGGLGGILHEFAQSGGKLLLTRREADGIYLGSLTGMLLGMLAGVLAVQGLFSSPPPQMNTPPAPAVNMSTSGVNAPAPQTPNSALSAPTPQPPSPAPSAPQPPLAIQALYAALLAGLGLKGVAEAVTGQSVPSSPGPLPANARIPIDLPPNPQPPKLG